MTKPTSDNNSPSASSIFIPQLRHSRRGSLASLSAAAQLDKETLAQALDEIHSSACQTETLTTFNEFTSPPSSSSGGDGKGLASELQGGLSGLYSRIRASVGNVRDIVSLNSDDGSVDDKSSKGHQEPITGPAQHAKQVTDSNKLSGSSVTSLNTSHFPETGPNDNDQRPKGSKHSIGGSGSHLHINLQPSSVSHSSIVPLTQATPGVAARPAIAEINVNAVKDLNQARDDFSNEITSPRPVPNSRVEVHSSDNVDKPNIDVIGSATPNYINNSFQTQQDARSTLDKAINSSRPGDMKMGKDSKTSRKSVSVPENDYFFQDSQFNSTESITQPGRDRSTNSRICNDAPRIVTNPATPRAESLVEHHTGADTNANPGLAREKNYQHLELPNRKSLTSGQAISSRSSDSQQSRKTSGAAASAPYKDPRQRLPDDEQTGGLDGRNHSSNLSRIISQQDNDPRTMNVFSQIKSKVLNKEFWMRDENARDCFYCGDPFSTFRRKHHCSKPIN